MNFKTSQDYIAYWNDFINVWYKDPIKYFNANNHPWEYLKNLKQDADALPEPYCGDPDNFSAIIINLNPGSVTPYLQQHPNGLFIKDFKPTGTYFNFAQNFPYLTKYPETGGGKWWTRRDLWIKRLINTDNNPFAIDICPWHSKSWGGFKSSLNTIKYVNDYVIKPAEIIFKNADLKIIVTVGSEFEYIFNELGFEKKETLGPLKNSGDWPLNSKNLPTNRNYSIWESQTGIFYLNTNCQGSNGCPKAEFNQLELKLIGPYI